MSDAVRYNLFGPFLPHSVHIHKVNLLHIDVDVVGVKLLIESETILFLILGYFSLFWMQASLLT